MDQNEILVTEENFLASVKDLLYEKELAVDTETTGFNSFKGASLFSIIICSPTKVYYFNFNWYSEPEVKPYILDLEKYLPTLRDLFRSVKLWIFQNAKFDLHMLDKEGLLPEGEYYCTQAAGRVLYNIDDSYSLDSMCEKYLGQRKDDAVMAYLEEHKLYQMVPVPGLKRKFKNYFFSQVPFHIISKYGMKDGKLTFALKKYQEKNFRKTDWGVINNEMRLIKTLFKMEKHGVLIDKSYIECASAFESGRVEGILKGWEMAAGSELVDSGEYLKPIFESLGFEIGKTEKGEPRIDADAIADIDHPLARVLEKYRDAEKRYTTFMGLLAAADGNNVVHTNFKQAGTVTGRMSSIEPNLQNLASDDNETPFPIRRAFIPRPGHFFLSIDYKQMEFRLLLEYAKELELIEKIKNGHSPHEATAEMTGLGYKAAKTLNFGLIYGMGIKKLARAIGVTEQEARVFKEKYFRALPHVREFLYKASSNQRKRGFCWNWMGRIFYLKEPRFSYRAPNSIIQGGCADVCKLAMNRLDEWLEYNSDIKMILQVHDEILFEVPYDCDLLAIHKIKEIMETAYPHKNIPLTCSVSYSLKSFYDMIELGGDGDIVDTLRESISTQSTQAPQENPQPMVLQN